MFKFNLNLQKTSTDVLNNKNNKKKSNIKFLFLPTNLTWYKSFKKPANMYYLNLINLVYNANTWNFLIKNETQPNLKDWVLKFQLLTTTYVNLQFTKRFRHKLIKTIFNVIFFENTIGLKNLFFLWIKIMPLNKHKQLIITLFENMVFIEFFNYLFYVRFKILFQVKGKLGLRGDNKKKKELKSFRPEHKHTIQTGLTYDGVGSASKFGLTFFKIMYSQTNFYNIRNDGVE